MLEKVVKYSFVWTELNNFKARLTERLVRQYCRKVLVPALREQGWDQVIFTPYAWFGDDVEENKGRPKALQIFWHNEEKILIEKGFYPSKNFLKIFKELTSLLENTPDGFLIKLKKTELAKPLKEALKEIGSENCERWRVSEDGFNMSEHDDNEQLEVVEGEIEVVEVKTGKARARKIGIGASRAASMIQKGAQKVGIAAAKTSKGIEKVSEKAGQIAAFPEKLKQAYYLGYMKELGKSKIEPQQDINTGSPERQSLPIKDRIERLIRRKTSPSVSPWALNRSKAEVERLRQLNTEVDALDRTCLEYGTIGIPFADKVRINRRLAEIEREVTALGGKYNRASSDVMTSMLSRSAG